MLESLTPLLSLPRPRRLWSRLGIGLTLVAGAFLLYLLFWNAASILIYPKLAHSSCTADTMLVMGAAQYNGTPSPAFQRRLDRALKLYNAGCASHIVVTGGRLLGDLYSEGGSGARYLLAHGVPADALRSERRSTTSYENLVYSSPLVPDKKLTIVTDDLHAYRTHYLAKRLGYEVELEPVYSPYGRLHYALRELAALTLYRLGFLRGHS